MKKQNKDLVEISLSNYEKIVELAMIETEEIIKNFTNKFKDKMCIGDFDDFLIDANFLEGKIKLLIILGLNPLYKIDEETYNYYKNKKDKC